MAACMLTLGGINASKTTTVFGKWLSVAVIYVFIATYVRCSRLKVNSEQSLSDTDAVFVDDRFSLTWAVCLKVNFEPFVARNGYISDHVLLLAIAPFPL